MKIKDVLNSKECKSIFKEIEDFVRESLFEYNNSIQREEFCFSDKDIFDFVWGTVNFTAHEVCILDSPLLQRLRRIRQLGLASTVYCNADSSRFSHTIGVTEVADRMACVVLKKLNVPPDEVYDIREIVRLAAIFHDVGHMFFSHVSELYFSYDKTFPRYKDVTLAKTFFCEQTSSNVSLHELFSVMIVNSEETERLLKLVAPHMKNSRLTQQAHYEQLIEYISCLIIGVPVDKTILPFSSIINSAIDADKLDYLSRDSACTKVPIAVDIARIIQKLDVVNIKDIEAPAIWNDVSSSAKPLKIMAIKSSARKIFWQLSNARSSMYESVYYHHKTLTAETMFRKALQKLYSLIGVDNISFTNIMRITDDYFNEHWNLLLLPSNQENTDEVQNIEKILKRIRERSLYKRVAAFSKDSMTATLSSVGKFFRNVIQNPLSEEYQNFYSLMMEEYLNIRELQGLKTDLEEEPVFMFIFSKYDAMASMPVESGDGFCIWSSALMKQETMEVGKKSKQELFYLLTNCKDRANVYLALEKVLTKFDIISLSKESSLCSKISYEQLNSLRMKLLELDYYKDSLYLLQDDIFTQLYDRKLFKEVVEKYHSFHGANSCKITESSLKIFLRQFLSLDLNKDDLKLLLDAVLRMLKTANYLDRDSFASHTGTLMSKIIELPNENKYIINIGGDFDSSKHLMYYFNDVPGRDKLIFDGSIENALSKITNKDCLCFFDDGAYSGKQVISIFQELMGVPDDQRTTNERHVTELTNENKEKLRKSKIVLSYLFFNSNSEEYIKSELNKLGLSNIEIIFVNELKKKIFNDDNKIFVSDEQKALARDCLKDIGKQILISTKKESSGEYKSRWDEERVDNSSLGYNDSQQLVVFSSNIPTYSITAFWANGKFKGRDWRGLFQRTIKD